MSTRPRRSRPQRCDGNSLAVAAQLVEKNHYRERPAPKPELAAPLVCASREHRTRLRIALYNGGATASRCALVIGSADPSLGSRLAD